MDYSPAEAIRSHTSYLLSNIIFRMFADKYDIDVLAVPIDGKGIAEFHNQTYGRTSLSIGEPLCIAAMAVFVMSFNVSLV